MFTYLGAGSNTVFPMEVDAGHNVVARGTDEVDRQGETPVAEPPLPPPYLPTALRDPSPASVPEPLAECEVNAFHPQVQVDA